MQPRETIDFFLNQSIRAEKGFLIAKNTHNFQLLTLNSRQLFKSHLMQGLITWKLGEDCRSMLEKALNSVLESVEILAKTKPEFLTEIPVERAKIIAFLLEKSIDINIEDINAYAPDRKLDHNLTLALESKTVNNEENLKLFKILEKNGFNLASKIYQSYFSILNDDSNQSNLVHEAENLFKDRSSDKFYSGADQTEGGGPDNKIVVDYRLSSILKKTGHVKCSHSWLW